MAAPNRVVAICFEQLDAALLSAVDCRRAKWAVVMVDACSFELVGLTIDAQSMLRVDFDFTNAERRGGVIDDCAGAENFDFGLVEARRIWRPKLRLREFGDQESFTTLFGGKVLLRAELGRDVALLVKEFAGDRRR